MLSTKRADDLVPGKLGTASKVRPGYYVGWPSPLPYCVCVTCPLSICKRALAGVRSTFAALIGKAWP